MKHNGWHQRQWERIEEEYQESAREVVRIMHHEMRVPLCTVAGALYISEKTLRKWCKWWNLETRAGGYVKKNTPGKVQLRARLLGYNNVSQAIADMRADGKRWEDIQLKLKCSSSTISRYINETAKGRYNLTEDGLRTKSKRMQQLNEQMKNGSIERGGFAKIPLEMVTRCQHQNSEPLTRSTIR